MSTQNETTARTQQQDGEDEVQGFSLLTPRQKMLGQMACWGFAGMGAAATGPVGAFAFGAAAQYCSAQYD